MHLAMWVEGNGSGTSTKRTTEFLRWMDEPSDPVEEPAWRRLLPVVGRCQSNKVKAGDFKDRVKVSLLLRDKPDLMQEWVTMMEKKGAKPMHEMGMAPRGPAEHLLLQHYNKQ